MTKDPESKQRSIHMEKLQIIQRHNINIKSNTFHLYRILYIVKHFTYTIPFILHIGTTC